MHFRFFNPEAPVSITRGHLPHWDQEGATYFITWRTADSIPKEVWEHWRADRAAWLLNHNIDPDAPGWWLALEKLPEPLRKEFGRRFARVIEDELDACHGEGALRHQGHAQIVADALRHFDGERYTLADFVVMPNHVHLLVGGLVYEAMLGQVESWKKWTALQINKRLDRRGRFWQDESFDHLVRSEAAFVKYRCYIAENPAKSKLRAGEFVHWARPELGL
ncbi:MAG: hypothetical protein K8R87_06455 [Verrucomicrobia bacterium]|nr:hypothetical protein [Verrucomicrobiota bacterium]